MYLTDQDSFHQLLSETTEQLIHELKNSNSFIPVLNMDFKEELIKENSIVIKGIDQKELN